MPEMASGFAKLPNLFSWPHKNPVFGCIFRKVDLRRAGFVIRLWPHIPTMGVPLSLANSGENGSILTLQIWAFFTVEREREREGESTGRWQKTGRVH